MEHLYEDRLREETLFILKKRNLQGDFIGDFQYLKGAYQKDGEAFLARACSKRKRVYGL